MTTVPPGSPLPSRRELRARERAGQVVPPVEPETPPSAESPAEAATGSSPVVVPFPADAVTEPPGERTLTRRELRALRAAQLEAEAASASAEAAESVPEPAAPEAEAESVPEPDDAPELVESAPVPDAEPESAPDGGAEPVPESVPEAAPESAHDLEVIVESTEVPIDVVLVEPDVDEPAVVEPEVEPVAEVKLFDGDLPRLVEPPTQPAGPTVPVGHWSRQAEADDDPTTADVVVDRREFGAQTPSTNSLVILPPAVDILPPSVDGPISARGEMMMTGSLQLPDDFSQTGVTGQIIDVGRDDLLLDPQDEQRTDAAQPVRASNAVSIHTETSGKFELTPQSGGKGLTALIVVASSMAVLVAGLLVIAIVTGLL